MVYKQYNEEMKEEKRCPKCGSKERVKRGFAVGRQRYLCKECGCNYTRSNKRGYSEEVKKEAIRYYLEGCGFRRIERLLGMSHVSVINWVKEAAVKVREKLRDEPSKEKKVEVIELDEMCVSFRAC